MPFIFSYCFLFTLNVPNSKCLMEGMFQRKEMVADNRAKVCNLNICPRHVNMKILWGSSRLQVGTKHEMEVINQVLQREKYELQVIKTVSRTNSSQAIHRPHMFT